MKTVSELKIGEIFLKHDGTAWRVVDKTNFGVKIKPEGAKQKKIRFHTKDGDRVEFRAKNHEAYWVAGAMEVELRS